MNCDITKQSERDFEFLSISEDCSNHCMERDVRELCFNLDVTFAMRHLLNFQQNCIYDTLP